MLYCSTPAKANEYSKMLSQAKGDTRAFDNFPEEFKLFIEHIRKEYDIDRSVDEWSLIQVLKNGFGMHHGKLPKYIQREILEQFNKGTFDTLFCTSTIVEGVNTDAKNMIILNPSKGRKKLTPFDIKNIKGRAGRYHHCFVGRVFYMSKELQEIEESEALALNFVTYSDSALGVIDLDNAESSDLTPINADRKAEREQLTNGFLLPDEVFIKNRTISKENQEKLLKKLMEEEEYTVFREFIIKPITIDRFVKSGWMKKILDTFSRAGLLDEITCKRFTAIAITYYQKGFKGVLEYEIQQARMGKTSSIDKAYSKAFESMRGVLEHRIPKILTLFESIIAYVAEQKGNDASGFSLSHIRRYFETGVKSLIGEVLIEYGFPTDAVRRIEENHSSLCNMEVDTAKNYCRTHYQAIKGLLDSYENQLFIKAMNSF